MFDKDSLIQRLKELPFSEKEYWVVAIELFEKWTEGTVETVGGVPVVCVDGLIQMKRKLGREKNLRILH